MSPQRYPNADYPTAYDEANMVKITDVPVNVTGTGVVVSDVTAGQGPLMEMDALTGSDVKGTDSRGTAPVETPEPEAAE